MADCEVDGTTRYCSPHLSNPISGGCEGKQRAMTRTKEAAKEKTLDHERQEIENAKEADAHWMSRSNS
ncbi:hypothetical protein TNCV_4956121 [Trichonephila clavipes]|nr:hypothetical protein TNCV_4956121 [Trichonephila clavipes]